MSHVLTMPAQSDVTMTITGPIIHMCPVVDEVDEGHITITWRVDGQTLELHSLAEYLSDWKDSHLSHEQLTDCIHHHLSNVVGIDLVSVKTTWLTAGLEVSCSTSPTHVALP